MGRVVVSPLAPRGDDDVADRFIALTAIATSTERIRLGALVTPVARLRPETVAQTSVTLDRFSGGRLILGVGLGNPDMQFRAFGGPADLRTRAAMTDEFLEVLGLLWSGEQAEHRGDHYTAVGVSMHHDHCNTRGYRSGSAPTRDMKRRVGAPHGGMASSPPATRGPTASSPSRSTRRWRPASRG